MVFYAKELVKRVQKNALQGKAFIHLDNVFKALDLTKDLKLFDLKRLKDHKAKGRSYYRLRKGKYRAIVYVEEEEIYVIAIDRREEVYRTWE
jgi:mRNA interferase RelE/StbE